jgi:hypothetical protein
LRGKSRGAFSNRRPANGLEDEGRGQRGLWLKRRKEKKGRRNKKIKRRYQRWKKKRKGKEIDESYIDSSLASSGTKYRAGQTEANEAQHSWISFLIFSLRGKDVDPLHVMCTGQSLLSFAYGSTGKRIVDELPLFV